jgi:pseudaminic acid biosynthesis-associated methylase
MRSEQERLEALWAGSFGDAYVDRNFDVHAHRADFWRELVNAHGVSSVLEVGCNVGGNLGHLAELLGADRVAGVDVNAKALEILRERLPAVDVHRANAARLPIDDRAYDLTCTMGVLIHQPDESLREVMGEVVRCSARLVFCCEYFAAEPEEVPYRGETGALFKRDYGGLYQEWFPDLSLVDTGFLGRDEGYDNANWWLLERPR